MLVVAQYDNVFRTLVNDCPKLLIPFINEVFQEHYPEETQIRFHPNEHFVNQKDGRMNKRITDTCFEILDTVPKKYHLSAFSNFVFALWKGHTGQNPGGNPFTGRKT